MEKPMRLTADLNETFTANPITRVDKTKTE